MPAPAGKPSESAGAKRPSPSEEAAAAAAASDPAPPKSSHGAFYAPYRVSEDEAGRSVLRWLKSMWFLPKGFLQEVRIHPPVLQFTPFVSVKVSASVVGRGEVSALDEAGAERWTPAETSFTIDVPERTLCASPNFVETLLVAELKRPWDWTQLLPLDPPPAAAAPTDAGAPPARSLSSRLLSYAASYVRAPAPVAPAAQPPPRSLRGALVAWPTLFAPIEEEIVRGAEETARHKLLGESRALKVRDVVANCELAITRRVAYMPLAVVVYNHGGAGHLVIVQGQTGEVAGIRPGQDVQKLAAEKAEKAVARMEGSTALVPGSNGGAIVPASSAASAPQLTDTKEIAMFLPDPSLAWDAKDSSGPRAMDHSKPNADGALFGHRHFVPQNQMPGWVPPEPKRRVKKKPTMAKFF